MKIRYLVILITLLFGCVATQPITNDDDFHQICECDTLEIVNNWKSAILWGFTLGLIIYSITEYQDGINGDNGIRDMSGKP